jgi:hypothetical protein
VGNDICDILQGQLMTATQADNQSAHCSSTKTGSNTMGKPTKTPAAASAGRQSPAPIQITVDEPDTDKLRAFGGSSRDTFNAGLINAVASTEWIPAGISVEARQKLLLAAITGMKAFNPTDEIEGMLAAQAMAMHHASMECSRRAMLADQPTEAAHGFRKAAANASRTFAELLSAFDRKRGKGGQHVRVEHVHVHSGGKAIVGNVETGGRGGGGEAKTAGGPHAVAQLAHEPSLGSFLPSLRSPDAEREPVRSSGDAERPMPDARRKQHGAKNG